MTRKISIIPIVGSIRDPIKDSMILLKRMGLGSIKRIRACFVWIPYMVISYTTNKPRKLCMDAFFFNKLANRLNIVFLIRNNILKYGVKEMEVNEECILPLEYLDPKDVLKVMISVHEEAKIYHDILKEHLKGYRNELYPELIRKVRNLNFIKSVLEIIGVQRNVKEVKLEHYIYYPEVFIELDKEVRRIPIAISLGGEFKVDSIYTWLMGKDPLFEQWVLKIIDHYYRDDKLQSVGTQSP